MPVIVRLRRRGAAAKSKPAMNSCAACERYMEKIKGQHQAASKMLAGRRRGNKVTITKPDYWDKLHAKQRGISPSEAAEQREQKATEAAQKAQEFLNDGHRVERSNTRLNLRTLVPHMRAADPTLHSGGDR